MVIEDALQTEKIFTQPINADWLKQNNVTLDVLRLDTMHSIVSGNKWFKLKYYLEDAKHNDYDTIGTFGGSFSNHIIATACACNMAGLKSVGIIRGEQPTKLSHTLFAAQQYGMKFQFVTRSAYRNKEPIKKNLKNVYCIPEGGYGELGVRGAREIFSFCNRPENYTHIVCATGTGTMMAGIIQFVRPHQTVIGISVMKGNDSLLEEVNALLSDQDRHKLFKIIQDYHFGGYAKHPNELIQFMNETWKQHQLPTDIVYTAKTFFAVRQMIVKNIIPLGSNVLMIHSGGLQGNLSLTPKTLCF